MMYVLLQDLVDKTPRLQNQNARAQLKYFLQTQAYRDFISVDETTAVVAIDAATAFGGIEQMLEVFIKAADVHNADNPELTTAQQEAVCRIVKATITFETLGVASNMFSQSVHYRKEVCVRLLEKSNRKDEIKKLEKNWAFLEEMNANPEAAALVLNTLNAQISSIVESADHFDFSIALLEEMKSLQAQLSEESQPVTSPGFKETPLTTLTGAFGHVDLDEFEDTGETPHLHIVISDELERVSTQDPLKTIDEAIEVITNIRQVKESKARRR